MLATYAALDVLAGKRDTSACHTLVAGNAGQPRSPVPGDAGAGGVGLGEGGGVPPGGTGDGVPAGLVPGLTCVAGFAAGPLQPDRVSASDIRAAVTGR
jgi:hypothetical protein